MANIEEHEIGRARNLNTRSWRTSIELPIIINLIAINVTGSALSNVLLYKTCLHSLNHTEHECEPFLSPVTSNDTQEFEQEIQEYVSSVITVRTVVAYIGPMFLSLFMGVWSDTYGRKPLMVWSIFGMFMNATFSAIYSMVDSMGPWWYVVAAIPFSVTGGYVVMFTGAYCYVSDTSSNERTSIRMALIDATIPLGQFIGLSMTSYLILAIGHIQLLCIAALLNLIAFAYIIIFIKESVVGAELDGASKVLNISHVKKMFRECFKNRPNYGRAVIMMCSLVKAGSVLVLYGTSILEYMYTRQKLQWDLTQYNVYSSVNTVLSFAGGLFGVFVVQRLLRISDILFAIFTLVTAIEEFMIKFFATTPLEMYRSSVVSMFKALLGALLRSHLKKTLPIQDIATVFAFMCSLETISPVIAPLIYNSLYADTVGNLPGSIYLLSMVFASISLVILCFVLDISEKTKVQSYRNTITKEIAGINLNLPAQIY